MTPEEKLTALAESDPHIADIYLWPYHADIAYLLAKCADLFAQVRDARAVWSRWDNHPRPNFVELMNDLDEILAATAPRAP